MVAKIAYKYSLRVYKSDKLRHKSDNSPVYAG